MHAIVFAHPDRKLVELYKSHLRRHFLVDSAHDGITALRKIRLAKPALIVSEYDLPHLSGLALLKFIRNNPVFSLIPFIFLTDCLDPSEALSHGANDWLNRRTTGPDKLIEKIFHHIKHHHYV